MSDEDRIRRIEQLKAAHKQGFLDDDTFQAALEALGETATFQAKAEEGAVAQGENSTALNKRAANVGQNARNVNTGDHVVIAEEGAHVYLGREAPVEMAVVDRESALGRYLEHIIARNRYLQLQGIRSGGRLVHIELEHIYITLRATQRRTITAEEAWLKQEAALAPGEMQRRAGEPGTETVTVTVNEALADHQRLIILGDPGSGKTTLLRFLALVYARDLAHTPGLITEKLGIEESGRLPILLPLRQIGAFLRKHGEEATEGHRLLLQFLHNALQNERIMVPLNFFDDYLQTGNAVLLLDGMDEVSDANLRRRVSRLIESFVRAYPSCRTIVTSRIVGYTGATRLGEAFAVSTVRDFTLNDIKHFLTHWHRLIAVGQMGLGDSANQFAAAQTEQLISAIQENERIRELAINPLLLTVLALVHRDRVKLPDRRAELYAEAVDVLLGKWDEARGVVEQPILENAPFDTGDKRLMLQKVALHMHQASLKEIETNALRQLLFQMFVALTPDNRAAERAVARFIQVIEERAGLLTSRGEGVYAFSHLTFQEYLAALAVAGRDDYVTYSLQRADDSWWREVILLTAGYLSMQSKERTTKLIRAIADKQVESEPYHNLVLAAACLNDVGSSRVQGELQEAIRTQLEAEFVFRPRKGWWGSVQLRLSKGLSPKALVERRIAAATALAQIEGQGKSRYWSPPFGEPEWVEIPAGEFWLGSDAGPEAERPQHKLYLDSFKIARVPITNAQYALFVVDNGYKSPYYWEDGRIPKGLESHPVVGVTWHDAVAYCQWLSERTGQNIRLPSEAEWEKAARGAAAPRTYPWGETFDETRCNSEELQLDRTTPVGIFPAGASPYGVLDMSGNVFEWTRSWHKPYPYDSEDGREEIPGDRDRIVLRGGSFLLNKSWQRCGARNWLDPLSNDWIGGFRVVVSPFFDSEP